MKKTLTIRIGGFGHVGLRLKGLSFKALENTDIGHELIRGDSGDYELLGFSSKINPKTANIELNYLLGLLKELHDCIPFDKVKIVGHYEVTGEQLYKLVTE